MSLTNIANTIRYHGPMNDFNEGVDESYIQAIKGELENMRHTVKFLCTVLRKVLQTAIFSAINEGNPMSKRAEYARTCNFKVYMGVYTGSKQIHSMHNYFERDIAMAGIIDREGKLWLCWQATRQKEISLYPVVFKDAEGKGCYNLWYAPASLGVSSRQLKERHELSQKASDFFLMLRHRDFGSGWTVICKSWRVRDGEGKLRLPIPDQQSFKDVYA